jgi:hypothetical protein
VAVAGGVKVPEPGVDLAVAMAVASAAYNRPVPQGVVVCGEMGLGGELRQVQRTERRLAEAARLGFDAAIVPRSAPDPPAGLRVVRAPSLRRALHSAGILGSGSSSASASADSSPSPPSSPPSSPGAPPAGGGPEPPGRPT